MDLSLECGSADLARRLRAAADGGDYQEGLSDDEDEDDDNDAEISEVEEAFEPQQHAAFADDHMQTSSDQEQEEELDIMNSPAQQPWGTEVRAFPLLLCGWYVASAVTQEWAYCCWPTCGSLTSSISCFVHATDKSYFQISGSILGCVPDVQSEHLSRKGICLVSTRWRLAWNKSKISQSPVRDGHMFDFRAHYKLVEPQSCQGS